MFQRLRADEAMRRNAGDAAQAGHRWSWDRNAADVWELRKEAAGKKPPSTAQRPYGASADQWPWWCASTALRVASSVKASDSFGMPVTKDLIIQPSPVGMSRVSEATSLWR